MRDSLIQMLYDNQKYYTRIANKVVKNTILAEDVVQETALKLSTMDAGSFPEAELSRTWLGSVVIVNALYFIRKEKKRAIRASEVDMTEFVSATTPETEFSEVEQTASVKKAIQKLPPQQRGVVEAVFLRGLNLVEAAKFLNYSSYDTCKAAYRQAALALKETLSGVA